jgi:hypothetical protein
MFLYLAGGRGKSIYQKPTKKKRYFPNHNHQHSIKAEINNSLDQFGIAYRVLHDMIIQIDNSFRTI